MRAAIIKNIKFSLIALSLSLFGCVVDQGTETTPVNYAPPDFDVPATGTTDDPSVDVPADDDDPPVSTQIQKIEIVSPNPTKDPTISLKVIGMGWPWMKVGFDNHCNDGQWEIFANQKTVAIPSSQMNKDISLSVMFSDMDSNDSICYVTTVRHDNKGPEIILKRYPAPSIEEGSAPEIEYQVTDVSGVAQLTCGFTGLLIEGTGATRDCPAGGPHTIKLTQLKEGSYDFGFTATDSLGNKSTAHVPWEVVNKYRRLTQKFEIKDQRKVDILMVVDNSGSMAYEQKNMAQRTSNLLSVIRGLDWQIGVTTTDPRSAVAYGDGQLVKFDNYRDATYVINSSMPEAEAQKNLADTLQRAETGSASEQGIFATYRALERSQTLSGGTNGRLIRANAQFASVVISDEDESANGPKNDPHNLIKYISDTFGGTKNFSFHSIILKPGDKNCPQGATAGNRYKTLSDLTGGVVGSVCEQDYSQQVIGIANGIRNLLKTLTLECEPILARGLTITKDGAPFSLTYAVEGVNLKFASELSEGQYAVDYACLK